MKAVVVEKKEPPVNRVLPLAYSSLKDQIIAKGEEHWTDLRLQNSSGTVQSSFPCALRNAGAVRTSHQVEWRRLKCAIFNHLNFLPSCPAAARG